MPDESRTSPLPSDDREVGEVIVPLPRMVSDAQDFSRFDGRRRRPDRRQRDGLQVRFARLQLLRWLKSVMRSSEWSGSALRSSHRSLILVGETPAKVNAQLPRPHFRPGWQAIANRVEERRTDPFFAEWHAAAPAS